MKNFIVYLNILFLILVITGCGSSVKYKKTGMYMRNLFEIEVTTAKSETAAAEKRVNQAVDLLKKLDSSLNTLSPISEISAVNNSAARKSVSVSAEVYELIVKSIKAYRLTSGYFDIAWQPLIELFSKNKYPNYQKISEAKSLSSSVLIEPDENFNKIEFATPGVQISLELVKIGFAIDKIANLLDRNYVESLKISSGSTHYLGKKIMPLAITLSNDHIINLKIYNQGVTTTFEDNKHLANYEAWSKYLDIRPTTENIKSVTVVAPNAFTAEALSASFLLMGTEKSFELIDKMNKASSKNNYYAIFLLDTADSEVLIDSRQR